MKKQILLIGFLFGVIPAIFAHNEIKKREIKRVSVNLPFDCTVTSSQTKTASGTDCDGNALTISDTESCTKSDPDCSVALTLASTCARLAADDNIQKAISTITDCP